MTDCSDNINSVAMVFAAVESAETDARVKVWREFDTASVVCRWNNLRALTANPGSAMVASMTLSLLLTGQSNMAGRGALGTVTTERENEGERRIFAWGRRGAWQPACDPLHWDKPEAGVGPGLSCAKELLRLGVCDSVRLVPAAVGGSPIAAWRPGALFSDLGVRPYDDAISRCQAALDGASPTAILWHQGESDANESDAPVYANRLWQLIAGFRVAFDSPTLPVVVGTLGDFLTATSPWAQMVNEALLALPQRVPHTACVSARSLTDSGDRLHFDAEGARELGRRYATAISNLIARKA